MNNATFGAEFLMDGETLAGGTRPMTVGEYENMIALWHFQIDMEMGR